MAFFDGSCSHRRTGTACAGPACGVTIDLDVLMASAAIPFIFPAIELDGEYYGDGAMRQLAPLSPAVHLGANRVLVIGTRGEPPATPADRRDAAAAPPSPGHLLGFVLDSLFTDGLSIDLERLRQINRSLIAAGAPGHAGRGAPIDVLVIQPSEDPTAIARRHAHAHAAQPAHLAAHDRRARGAGRPAGELPAVRVESTRAN